MALRIFVKRGAIWRFHRLQRDVHEMPISVEWDRRQQDRREKTVPSDQDQRKADRRGAAPFTWDAAEFVIVEEPAPGADRSNNPTERTATAAEPEPQ